MKIACDASSIISLADSCLLGLLETVDAEFTVPKSVKREIMDDPYQTKRYLFNAVKMRQLIDEGTLHVYEKDLQNEARRFMDLANSVFYRGSRSVRIIQQGEAEALMCARDMKSNAVLCDERTMRELIESPEALADTLRMRINADVAINGKALRELGAYTQGIDVVRSAELLVCAYEKGLMEPHTPDLLEGALYSLKFAGCAISNEDMDHYRQMFRK